MNKTTYLHYLIQSLYLIKLHQDSKSNLNRNISKHKNCDKPQHKNLDKPQDRTIQPFPKSSFFAKILPAFSYWILR